MAYTKHPTYLVSNDSQVRADLHLINGLLPLSDLFLLAVFVGDKLVGSFVNTC